MAEDIISILISAILTFAMALLRLLADGERRFFRLLIEAFYCMGLGLTALFTVFAMGANIYWGMATGLLVGNFGSAYTRVVFRTLLLRKLQIEDLALQGFTHVKTGKEHEETLTGSIDYATDDIRLQGFDRGGEPKA